MGDERASSALAWPDKAWDGMPGKKKVGRKKDEQPVRGRWGRFARVPVRREPRRFLSRRWACVWAAQVLSPVAPERTQARTGISRHWDEGPPAAEGIHGRAGQGRADATRRTESES